MQIFLRLLIIFCLAPTGACNYVPDSVVITRGNPDSTSTGDPPAAQTPVYTFSVANVFAHDPSAFTQGLVYADGILYEGTGINGASSIRKVELATGAILKKRDLDAQYFGEGIAVFGDRLYQLTWRARTCFVYDKNTFESVAQFAYPTEGWGLTHDGRHLIMSDGTATLSYRDPETFGEMGRLVVTDTTGPVYYLNELEYVKGEIYANVWQTDRIARIDPQTGKVTAWIDLAGLLPPTDRQGVDVLNGIAYDAENDRLFVTGKWWPKLFQITLTSNP